eukprot:GILJ01010095.1.p1 GENE.GILJ01010095.1~~GILJ01010095.1.p1  ORF type:complete len:1405 (-),score=241.75 GILJ01010095.1:247-4461(-)
MVKDDRGPLRIQLVAARRLCLSDKHRHKDLTKRAVALYDYNAKRDAQLTFKTGDVIKVISFEPSGWWWGEDVQGKQGWFPGNYVELTEAANRISPDLAAFMRVQASIQVAKEKFSTGFGTASASVDTPSKRTRTSQLVFAASTSTFTVNHVDTSAVVHVNLFSNQVDSVEDSSLSAATKLKKSAVELTPSSMLSRSGSNSSMIASGPLGEVVIEMESVFAERTGSYEKWFDLTCGHDSVILSGEILMKFFWPPSERDEEGSASKLSSRFVHSESQISDDEEEDEPVDANGRKRSRFGTVDDEDEGIDSKEREEEEVSEDALDEEDEAEDQTEAFDVNFKQRKFSRLLISTTSTSGSAEYIQQQQLQQTESDELDHLDHSNSNVSTLQVADSVGSSTSESSPNRLVPALPPRNNDATVVEVVDAILPEEEQEQKAEAGGLPVSLQMFDSLHGFPEFVDIFEQAAAVQKSKKQVHEEDEVFFENLILNLINNESPTSQAMFKALDLFKSDKGRVSFGYVVLFAKDRRELSESMFNIIKDLMKAALREANNHRGFKSALLLLLVASHCYLREKDTPPTMLATLQDHEIWRNPRFWEEIFHESISIIRRRQEPANESTRIPFQSLASFSDLLKQRKDDSRSDSSPGNGSSGGGGVGAVDSKDGSDLPPIRRVRCLSGWADASEDYFETFKRIGEQRFVCNLVCTFMDDMEKFHTPADSVEEFRGKMARVYSLEEKMLKEATDIRTEKRRKLLLRQQQSQRQARESGSESTLQVSALRRVSRQALDNSTENGFAGFRPSGSSGLEFSPVELLKTAVIKDIRRRSNNEVQRGTSVLKSRLGMARIFPVTPPERIRGESQLARADHIMFEGPQNVQMSGTFFLTNYQLQFVPYKHDFGNDSFYKELFSIPLLCINRIERSKREMLLKIWCKDLRVLRFSYISSNADALADLYKQALHHAFLSFKRFFTFQYGGMFGAHQDGWRVYDMIEEFTRQGVVGHYRWKATDLNKKYKLCSTYPNRFFIPAGLTDEEIIQISRFRSRGRMPVLCWRNPRNESTIHRCSQPLVGVMGKRCRADEKYMQLISCRFIVDARPQTNAFGNKVVGKGFELTGHYNDCEIVFMNIANIHRIRASHQALAAILDPYHSNIESLDEDWPLLLDRTLWLRHIKKILTAAVMITEYVEKEGFSLVVHCSDGWDRTSQLTALSQLLLDPFFRTIRGFEVLVEKEWLSFGHKFAERMGPGSKNYSDDRRSPIFLQFLDCVWQIWHQFPCSFEFNEMFLFEIMDAVYSGKFGTFLCDSERERIEHHLSQRTVSLWTHINTHIEDYLNVCFRPRAERPVLFPQCGLRHLRVWSYHTRWDKNLRPQDDHEKTVSETAEKNNQLQAEIEELKARLQQLGSSTTGSKINLSESN